MEILKSDGVLLATEFPDWKPVSRGKVRDIYAANGALLFVATDRISAFDCVLPTGIPDKGRVLTQTSLFWFDLLRHIIPNHLLTADPTQFPTAFQPYLSQLEGRAMLVKKAQMVPVECVVRGYVAGSAWKEYRASNTVCGIPLPAGLREADRLPEPIFTPATKEQTGHDINISFDEMTRIVGAQTANRLRDASLAIYKKAAAHAEQRGIIIADTKFEFGFVDGELVLADEVLTPDSSRFWPRSEYQPGGSPPSFDKQYVRDYLEAIHWNKQPPAPALPPEITARTAEKYREAFRQLTGSDLKRWAFEHAE